MAFLGLSARSDRSAGHERLLAQLEREQRELETSRDIVRRLRLRLLVDLAQGPRLGDVARGLAVAPRTLQLHLAERGTSFQGELSRVRLDVARRYLRQTSEPVGVVAARVGFRSCEAFSRFFASGSGLSPRAYRRAGREA
jgi:AraC-like DNA-binding protein